ncbi:MAG: flavodoxin [Clostridium perfringens]|nr:flavodoxin [Clostridium perfringens]
MSKTLVAYFSCSGITEKLAKTLSSVVHGDLYKIEPRVPYTDADLNWHDKNSRSSIEMKDMKSRPQIESKLENMNDYDVVYVGFPIWWYVAPTIINTFLESYDFSGKIVIPFATSGMSGVGETDKWLHPSCSKETNWRPAKRFGNVNDKIALKSWVNGLKL